MISRLFLILSIVSLFLITDSIAQDLKKLNLNLIKKIQTTAGSANDQVNLLVQGDITALKSFISNNGGILRYHYGDIANVYIPTNKVYSLSEQNWAHRIESPSNNHP